ncbi:hypothetical protein [Schlesneria sp. DSM 10557]|uniref:hypothetical protein n=1 Tax=Schlesneria sp. DSM 10557 TaxID=3044399 RepID=UPI0035A040BD
MTRQTYVDDEDSIEVLSCDFTMVIPGNPYAGIVERLRSGEALNDWEMQEAFAHPLQDQRRLLLFDERRSLAVTLSRVAALLLNQSRQR